MNLHKNARLTPQGRLLLVQRVTEHGWTVGAAARAAGLSERQAYRWLARYRAGGTAALMDRSSAPRRCPHEVPAARVAAIEHWRHQRLSGPASARQLDMPVSTVGGACAVSGSAGWPPSSRGRRSCAISANGRASCSTSTPRSSGGSRRSAIGSPARRSGPPTAGGPGSQPRDVTPGVAPAGRPCTSASTTPRAWPTARCCRMSARPARSRSWNARSPGSLRQGVTCRARHDRQRLGVPQPSLAPCLRRAGAAPHPHPAVHAADQRQGRALHPDQPARVGQSLSSGRRKPDPCARPFASSHERTAALIPWLDHDNTARPHAALAHQPPATRLQPPAFLGSTDGTVPPSRPAISHDRSAGAAQGRCAPAGAGRLRRERPLRRAESALRRQRPCARARPAVGNAEPEALSSPG